MFNLLKKGEIRVVSEADHSKSYTGISQKSSTNTPRCPKCGKALTTINFTEYGTKTWTSQGWEEIDAGDAEWYTGCCDAKLNYDDLEKLRVF
jgi:hypothetical protein